MWVQMIEGISGGRPGGGPWPPRGYVFEVEDWEGEDLVRKQLARQTTNPFPPAAAAPKVAEEASPEVMEEADPEPVPAEELPEPSPTDLKSAWVDYAVSLGANREEAEGLTKSQLQSAYGGRLLS